MKIKVLSTIPRLVAYALFLTILSAAPAASSAAGLAMRADLTHVDSGRGFTRWELLSRMAARCRAHTASRHHGHRRGGGGRRIHPATATVAPDGNVVEAEYLVHLGIGTPRPQRVALTMDTGSDLVWTQCAPCPVCFHQPFPVFDRSGSRTFRPVPCFHPICGPSPGVSISACLMPNPLCFYLCSYGDKSVTAGFLFWDTFTFKAPDGRKGGGGAVVAVPDLAFGCGDYNTGVFFSNESGIAGFGRGPQSLPSQLRVGRFSYCLTSQLEGTASAVFLGTPDDLGAHATGPALSTPIIHNPAYPTFYYLSFKGVTVGETQLPIDEAAFAINEKDGSGGTVIDSGTAITTFPKDVFRAIKSAFLAQMPPLPVNTSVLGPGTLCLEVPPPPQGTTAATPPRVPRLVFHLDGADMDLPRESYILEDDALMCLILHGAGSGGGKTTVIGNFQQQNMHVVYDVEKSKLHFVPARCDKL